MRFAIPLLFALTLLGAPVAKAETAPSIEATLNANVGQKITLRLNDGDELSGTLAATSPVTVKLTGLTGKDFYDAVIRLDQIAAVIVRAPGK